MRPSTAIVIVVLALIAAVAGTAVAADPAATTSVTKKKVKKLAKKQANKQITRRAPGLSVAEAVHAATAGDAGFAQRTASLPLILTENMQQLVSTNVTTTARTRVMAVASVLLNADGGDNDRALCVIRIAGVDSATYAHDVPEGFLSQSTTALTFARELGPGTHAVALRCSVLPGSVAVEEAGISAWGVGS